MKRKTVFLVSVVPALLWNAAASAQSLDEMDSRVDRLEHQMHAVQRKVFPGGNEDYFKPEITAPAPGATASGVPASAPISDLSARVDALEQQLAALTGQIEENGYKTRQLEAGLDKFRSDTQFRLTQLEGGAPPPEAGSTPAFPFTAPPGSTESTAAGLDPVEAEYRAAYGHVVAKDWTAAESALQGFVSKHPDSARASNAQYWLGRTYLAENQPVEAARTLLANYQKRPGGERAPESLLWLGKSLMAFSPPSPEKACEAYAQLKTSYGGKLSSDLQTQVADARAAAKCK